MRVIDVQVNRDETALVLKHDIVMTCVEQKVKLHASVTLALHGDE
jgi:hypothetical protein